MGQLDHVNENVGWQGDYTLDYNYQAPFWAAFPTNHVDLADSYDAPILRCMDRGRGLAKEIHSQGLVYYTHLAPSPGWSAGQLPHPGSEERCSVCRGELRSALALYGRCCLRAQRCGPS